MAKTRQVMTLAPDYDGQNHYVVVYNEEKKNHNPYTIYRKWYDRGWHRKKIVEYANMDSVLMYLLLIKYPELYLKR